MKKMIALCLVLLLTLSVVLAMVEGPAIDARVVGINEYGHATLDITEADFSKAGFDLGDIVTVTCGSYSGDVPVFNGYYTDRGGCMIRIDPHKGDISLCINYGNFSEAAGVGAKVRPDFGEKHQGDAVHHGRSGARKLSGGNRFKGSGGNLSSQQWYG